MELSVQSVKTQHQKELDGREEDMEQLKATMNKKLKTMEQQLEEEHESKQQALKVMHTERERVCVWSSSSFCYVWLMTHPPTGCVLCKL